MNDWIESAWSWVSTEKGADELLTWMLAVGMPIAVAVAFWSARTMWARTTTRTRLGTSLIGLFISLGFFFAAFAILAFNTLATTHDLYPPLFWLRMTARTILALSVAAVVVASIRLTTDLRRLDD